MVIFPKSQKQRKQRTPNIFQPSYGLVLQHTAQWDVNVSIGAKDWWHPTTRHNSDFSSLHVVNTQNSFVYHMEGVTSIIFRNFLSEPLQNFYTLLFMQVYFTMPVFTYKVFFFFGSIIKVIFKNFLIAFAFRLGWWIKF